MLEDYQLVVSCSLSDINLSEHALVQDITVTELKLGEYVCYVTKNIHGGWLAYIDVTDYPELYEYNCELIDSILPFHGGCTFAQWASHIGKLQFDKEHFLIGCDWCHAWNFGNAIASSDDKTLFGVEDVSFDVVRKNLEDVTVMMSEFRLKMTIRGNNI